MERYRFLPHTADVRFKAYGKSLSAALENSALALLNLMLDVKRIEKDGSRSKAVGISESADTESELAWFTLQDILSKVDAKKLNAYSFKITSLKKDANGRSILMGRLLCKNTATDNALLSVKAVTPHELTVKRFKKHVTINVVVDV
jgi:SHS2 domain-containing protein